MTAPNDRPKRKPRPSAEVKTVDDTLSSQGGRLFTYEQAQNLLAIFGGDEETTVIVKHWQDGHSGPGLYAYFEDYPDEGSQFLGGYETGE